MKVMVSEGGAPGYYPRTPETQPPPQPQIQPAPPQPQWNIRELASIVKSGQLAWATQPGVTLTGVTRTPTGYSFQYVIAKEPQQDIVRDLAQWMKTPEGQQWSRENLFGRPGIDYDVRDLAMAAKLHPEWFVVAKPPPVSSGPFVNWEEPARMGVPTAIFQTPGGYTVKPEPTIPEQISSWVSGIGETINPLHKTPRELAELALSEVAFRQVWDPAWRERYKTEFEEPYTELGPEVQKRQTELYSTAIGVGLIAYTAYDVGRNLYNIIKYRDLIREPIMTYEKGPEGIPEKFQVISMSGPKGERTSDLMDVVPKATPIEDTFSISPTRGKWSGKPIIEDTKASTTLTDLFMIRPVASLPTLISYSVPFGSYEPFLTTEMVAAGISFGQLLPKATAPSKLKLPKIEGGEIAKSEISMPTRLVTITKPTLTPTPRTTVIERSKLIDFTVPAFIQDQWQEVTPIQQQKQASGQIQIQIQRSAMKNLQQAKNDFKMPTDFMRKPRRRKGKDFFGLHGWTRSFYPIKRAKEFLKGV